MLEYLTTLLIGLIGGAAVGIQSPIAGAMGQRVGGAAGSVIVHLSGLILSVVLLVVRGGERIRDWAGLPWYMLGAGGLGVILYLTINVTLPRLGSTMMVTLIIIGQLVVGILVDHFGWFGVPVHPISAGRLLGVAILLVGGYLIAR